MTFNPHHEYTGAEHRLIRHRIQDVTETDNWDVYECANPRCLRYVRTPGVACCHGCLSNLRRLLIEPGLDLHPVSCDLLQQSYRAWVEYGGTIHDA